MIQSFNEPIADSAEREKVIRLVDYLTRIAQLRSKVVRNVDEYQSVLWLNDVPSLKGCFTQAWGRDENHDSDIWIEIQRPIEPELPIVPDLCNDWVKIESLRNTSDLPEILPEIAVLIDNPDWSEDSEQPESIPHTNRLEDYPEVQKAWDSYVESKWLDWAADYKAWESIHKVYSHLFTIDREQSRLGEEYELVLGLGLLIWRSPSGQNIRRHLLVSNAMLEFETELGKFTVKPHPEGAKLRPELDMLDAEECPPNAETMAMDALKENDDPWEKNVIDRSLKSLVHSFDTQGVYDYSLETTDTTIRDKPVVIYAPALILRKRSTRGLTNMLRRIREHIEKGEDIPSEFRDLAEIPQLIGEHADSDSEHAHLEFNGEVFFPKPYNEEQRRIVEKIQVASGVLVQGPPGTGKSHTIANLICHLLATGQRTLITAKTPRALKVLEELVPEELRALCINLIDSGSKETSSLESSVMGILQKHNDWSEDRSCHERKKLEEHLRQLRNEKSEVERRLSDIRESETCRRSIANGTYPGTAAEIAKAVNRDRNTYEWFTDDVTEDKTCPISDDDLHRILKELRHFTPEKRRELELELPDALPSLSLWEELVEDEVKATKEENSAENGAVERVAAVLSSQTGADIESIRDTLNQFLDMRRNLMALAYSWMEGVVRDAIVGNTDSWRQILEATKHTLTTIEPLVEVADNTDINNPKEINLNSLHQASTELLLHLRNGGKLTLFCILPKSIVVHRGLIKKILVNGRRPSTLQDFQDLEMALRVRRECEKAWGFWLGRAEKPQGPFQLQMLELKRLGDALQKALSLEELTNNCREIIRLYPVIGEPVWFDELQVEMVVASCRLALARQHKRECERKIRKIENPIASLVAKSNTHPLTSKLHDAIRERSTDSFTIIANELQDLRDEQERVRQLDNDVSAVRQHLPRLVDELDQTCIDPRWDDQVEQVQSAWCWAYARYWVEEYVRQEDVPALAQRAKQNEDDINNTIAQLSAQYAWSFCFSRLTKHRQENMVAWQQAMSKIGKGTGRQAWRYRREAQHHLNQCYEAAPAWVMPLHRVWDTVDPVADMFDVIIVDEASQCGVEAMPLLFLGKKILIVGDDKQISPAAVGLNIDDVYRLINEYLYDFNFHGVFHVASSLFDYGKLRYGTQQRITLREHFRCMPEIIRFSNNLCYSDTPLIPLRQYGPNRLIPLEHEFVNGGYREGSGNQVINRPEADAIVDKIVELCNDSTGRYDGKSMGVVVLQGEVQARLIEAKLLERLGAEEMQRRSLICGDPYSFQGDERHIMFLSMVAAPNQRIGPLTKSTDFQRFNVAASRAKDQMYLFHSVKREELSPVCLRRRLLEFFENTQSEPIRGLNLDELERKAKEEKRHIVKPPNPFESWFEVDVALEIARRGFNVIPQFEVAKRRIDLVIEGGNARLAVECDGDEWHGPDEYEADMFRQRQLERCGWEFFRVRQSAFYLDRVRALEGLWRALEERNIAPLRENTLKDKEYRKRLQEQANKRAKMVRTVNKSPLNQAALTLLKQVKQGVTEESDPPLLHSLRLLMWGLMKEQTLVDQDELLIKASQLAQLLPKEAQKYLMTVEKEPSGIVERLKAAKTPIQGAKELMDVILINLTADLNDDLTL